MVGEVLAAPALQLGALGVLAVFVALFMRQVAAQNEKRAERDAFIEGLVTRAFEAQDAHLESWRDMTKQTIEVYQQVGVAYGEMSDGLQANCDAIMNGTERSQAEHREIEDGVVNLHQALNGLDKSIAQDHSRLEEVMSGAK